jgi:(p)ppGpp synthase/HD superfamily hydrolase
MDERLKKIRDYADQAHGDQTRKYSPEPYIVHPERVMKTCAYYTSTLPVLAAALLHDVLEDTAVTEEEMGNFLETVMESDDVKKTLKLVVELTDVYTKKAYPQWNRDKRKQKEHERVKGISPDAQTVKYADIIDNCTEIVRHDTHFAPKYLKECLAILRVADRGDKQLYQLAMEALLEEQKKIGRA